MNRLTLLLLATAACAPRHDPPRHILALPPSTSSTAAPPTTASVRPPTVVGASRGAVRPRPLPPLGAGRTASTELLDALAQCESGGRASVVSGPHHGAFQWLRSSWDSHVARMGRPELVGVDPASLPYETQREITAAVPVSAYGRQFPVCGRAIGAVR